MGDVIKVAKTVKFNNLVFLQVPNTFESKPIKIDFEYCRSNFINRRKVFYAQFRVN
jgi:hypothetical protein